MKNDVVFDFLGFTIFPSDLEKNGWEYSIAETLREADSDNYRHRIVLKNKNSPYDILFVCIFGPTEAPNFFKAQSFHNKTKIGNFNE